MQILSMEAYLDQATDVLTRSPLFHGLDRESLISVAENAELLRFAPDEALASEGGDSDSFLLLVEGGATVVLDGGDGGPPVTLARISPPDSIGEMGVLLDQPRSASVYADGGAIAISPHRAEIVSTDNARVTVIRVDLSREEIIHAQFSQLKSNARAPAQRGAGSPELHRSYGPLY